MEKRGDEHMKEGEGGRGSQGAGRVAGTDSFMLSRVNF